jgi:CspA family cold shock protein
MLAEVGGQAKAAPGRRPPKRIETLFRSRRVGNRPVCVPTGLTTTIVLSSSVRRQSVAERRCSIIRQGTALMPEGTIKKLTDKGFGFIKTATEKDLFFHSKALQGVQFDDLREGQKVTYTEGRGPKGPCAENVQLA